MAMSEWHPDLPGFDPLGPAPIELSTADEQKVIAALDMLLASLGCADGVPVNVGGVTKLRQSIGRSIAEGHKITPGLDPVVNNALDLCGALEERAGIESAGVDDVEAYCMLLTKCGWSVDAVTSQRRELG